MATHSSVLAWRIPGTAGPGGLPSMGSHRVGHDWSDLAAAAAAPYHKRYDNLNASLSFVLLCAVCHLLDEAITFFCLQHFLIFNKLFNNNEVSKTKCLLNDRFNIEFLFIKKFYGKCVTYIKFVDSLFTMKVI